MPIDEHIVLVDPHGGLHRPRHRLPRDPSNPHEYHHTPQGLLLLCLLQSVSSPQALEAANFPISERDNLQVYLMAYPLQS